MNNVGYMTGDFDNASIDYKPDYAAAGFSSMVNFFFPKHGDLDNIVYTWQAYADSMAVHDNWHPFSYLNNSYHRDADMENMIDCATTFLLTPGVAQVFYGDETGRKLNDAQFNVDSDQAFRSDMDWNDIDEAQLEHYRKLGKMRRANPVIGRGRQRTIDTHTCVRYDDNDTILIKLRPEAGKPIKVSGIFQECEEVTELYTGQTAKVENGKLYYPRYERNLAILKSYQE